MTHHLFIVNPAAGKADRTEAIEKAVRSAKEQGDVEGEVSLYRTTAPGDATAYLTKYLRETEEEVRVYACGGDGTLNEVVRGIYASGKENVAQVAVDVQVDEAGSNVLACGVNHFRIGGNLVCVYDAFNDVGIQQSLALNDTVLENQFPINDRFHLSLLFCKNGDAKAYFSYFTSLYRLPP